MTTVPPHTNLVQTPGEPSPKIWRTGTLSYTFRGLCILFFWLLWGDFAWSIKERAIPSIVQLLFRNFGASDLVNGILLGSLPPAIGIILVPIISYKSDRHRGRWGRRIPFLLLPTPFVVLALVGLAFSPTLGAYLTKLPPFHAYGLDACALVFLGLFWTIFEFATVTANSLYGAFINDVVPQKLMGRFYGLFRAFSLIAAILFFFWLFGKAETLYIWIFLGIAALYGFGFTLMCLKVKEGKYPPRPPLDKGSSRTKGFLRGAITYFKQSFGKSYYRWFFAAMTLSAVATSPVNLFSVFFATSLKMDLGFYANCLALTYSISLVLAYPLGWLADRFHPLRMNITLLLLYSMVSLWGGLFARDPWTYAIALVAHGVVAGSWATCTASISQRLLPPGEFAQFDSAKGLTLSLGGMALAPLVGFILDHAHHTYRYTFLMGFGLSLVALLASLVLQRKFIALGGPDHYVAPE